MLVDSSRDPLIGFLADYMKDKKGTVKICGSDLLSEYSFYLKERNYKFDITPKKFTIDLKLKFNISTVKNSTTYYIIDSDYTKKLLTEKYQYSFNKVEEEIENPIDFGVKDEKAELKKQIEELQKQLNKLKTENEDLKLELELK